ncbi:MAG: Asp/Glu racemase, partial [Rhodospirillaceae bacterium]|nr:Asp/Glu racemase [Rhodospirillaceae bacterium]
MKLPFTLDSGIASKAAFGVIILQADETLEAEFRTVFNHPGWALYHSRIPSAPEVTPTTLQQMEADMPDAAALLPGATPLDVVAYACTSGAMQIGSDRIRQLIMKERTCRYVSDPMRAALLAFESLGAKNIGYLAPYSTPVCKTMIEHI